MRCPQCAHRPARRHCPGLGRQICPICCGTKRGTEIRCPESCPYLAIARRHPPAVERRQAEQDYRVLAPTLRGLTEHQARLLSVVFGLVARWQPDGLFRLADADLADATSSLAATFETAERGVIYEHRPKSMVAQRLATDLRARLGDLARQGWTGVEKDAAVVFRRVESAVALAGREHGGSPTVALELVSRAARGLDAEPGPPTAAGPDGAPGAGLIVPPAY